MLRHVLVSEWPRRIFAASAAKDSQPQSSLEPGVPGQTDVLFQELDVVYLQGKGYRRYQQGREEVEGAERTEFARQQRDVQSLEATVCNPSEKTFPRDTSRTIIFSK